MTFKIGTEETAIGVLNLVRLELTARGETWWEPSTAAIRAVAAPIVRHVRRRWRLRREELRAERQTWRSILVGLGWLWGPGPAIERRRGLGRLRLERALLVELDLMPRTPIEELSGRVTPPPLAGPGFPADCWAARWRYANCNSCGCDEEELGLFGGWTKAPGGAILCRWCQDPRPKVPPGAFRPRAQPARCKWCDIDLNKVTWSHGTYGPRCEPCAEARRKEGLEVESCDNCCRELPCVPVEGWSLCRECEEARAEGYDLSCETGGICAFGEEDGPPAPVIMPPADLVLPF